MVQQTIPSKTELAGTARSDKDAAVTSFGSAAIGMGWQLAIVVLLPIIGGYKLDQSAGSTPLWTLTGLAISLVASIFVIRRALAAFGNFSVGLPAGSARTSGTPANKEKHDS